MQKYPLMNPKQAVVLIGLSFLLWVPMALFIIIFVHRIPARALALVGLMNMFCMVTVLVQTYRRWIYKL